MLESAIADARVRDKEISIEFKDQEKAFDTLEDFQGNVIPMKVAKKMAAVRHKHDS